MRLGTDDMPDAVHHSAVERCAESESGRKNTRAERHQSVRRLLRDVKRNAKTRMVKDVFLEKIDDFVHLLRRNAAVPVPLRPPVGTDKTVHGTDQPLLHGFGKFRHQTVFRTGTLIGAEAVKLDKLSDFLFYGHSRKKIACAFFRTQFFLLIRKHCKTSVFRNNIKAGKTKCNFFRRKVAQTLCKKIDIGVSGAKLPLS